MGLTRVERTAHNWYRAHLQVPLPPWLSEHLGDKLLQAHRFVRTEVYFATSLLWATLATVASFALASALVPLRAPLGLDGAWLWPTLVIAPLAVGLAALGSLLLVPASQAWARRRRIEAVLPYGLNYIATVASAGLHPTRLFDGLAKQPVYGELAAEAGLISRDMQLLGMDLVTALQRASDRSPSPALTGLWQGAITALTSGDDLERFFATRSEQATGENRHRQRRFLDNLGVLAETYVTVVVGAPIFLIVFLSMTFVFGVGSPNDALAAGYGLVLVLVPLAQAAFIAILKSVTPEA